MEEFDYIELQRQYGGQYVVRRGNEVLVSAETYDQIVDWLEQHRPLRAGAEIQLVARPDVCVLY
jgi:hypothetical protein